VIHALSELRFVDFEHYPSHSRFAAISRPVQLVLSLLPPTEN
jgi:hypothetical protein